MLSRQGRELIVSSRSSLALLAFLVCLGGSKPSFGRPPSHQLLIASDLHFNPFADPTIVAELAAAPPARWEPILNRSKPAAYSPYGHDTNWWLLQSALDAMRSTEPHPALVMINGDLLAHGFPQAYAKATNDRDREHYRTFVLKTVAFIGWELGRRFKKSQILITPGNNDNECGDYDIEADGPFLRDTAALARKLARADGQFTADWKALGSYTLAPPAIRGVRILSVNSVFFSNKYQAASFAHACAPVDSTAAARTFAWLEANLAQAREAHEKVWLMLHIPPGIDGFSTLLQRSRLAVTANSSMPDLCSKAIVPMWKPVWTARFNGILEDYQSTVTATFAGHNHTDDFRVIHTGDASLGFVLINPPISPIYGQNPSFRLVAFGADGKLVDQSTYYLTNLPDARSDVPGAWKLEYTFAQEWQSQALNASTFKSLYEHITDDPAARAQWLTLLNVSSSHDAVPAAAVQTLVCAIDALDPASFQACYCPAPHP
jgi:sphingomyelin phosphodiesterase acid-like 3